MLSHLCNAYGIIGDALYWFRSYLIGRIQCVVIEDSLSVDQELEFGVPQGFVLGTKIDCMYTQLYITMDHSNNDWRDGLARIEL